VEELRGCCQLVVVLVWSSWSFVIIWRSLAVPATCLVVGGMVVVLAQDVPFSGSSVSFEVFGLGESQCLLAGG
jgi:hypothetical protein